jgi:hypothetical protein
LTKKSDLSKNPLAGGFFRVFLKHFLMPTLGSSPDYDLSNHTTYGQIKSGAATVPFRDINFSRGYLHGSRFCTFIKVMLELQSYIDAK